MTAAAIACPSCLAAPGEWCRRHGQTQPGPLLYCPERVEAARVEVTKVYRLRFEYSIEVSASSFEQVTAAALAELAALADGDTVAEWAGWELVEADPAQCVECDAPLDEYACPTCSPLDAVCVECCDCRALD